MFQKIIESAGSSVDMDYPGKQHLLYISPGRIVN
jgi:hypothetical protein